MMQKQRRAAAGRVIFYSFQVPEGLTFWMVTPLANALVRSLKARAQRLKATVKIGKDGLSPQFIAALDEALKHNELLKVKFDDLKDQKKELTPRLVEKTGSHLITRVGNVVVLYRPKPSSDEPLNTDLRNADL
jgi:RNA-binding protein